MRRLEDFSWLFQHFGDHKIVLQQTVLWPITKSQKDIKMFPDQADFHRDERRNVKFLTPRLPDHQNAERTLYHPLLTPLHMAQSSTPKMRTARVGNSDCVRSCRRSVLALAAICS